jgi:hypothetical protein
MNNCRTKIIKCRIYDTNSPDDMAEVERRYNHEQVKHLKVVMEGLLKKERDKKKHEFKTGDCCPSCGSIEYYQSGTCKTCRICGFAGSCG